MKTILVAALVFGATSALARSASSESDTSRSAQCKVLEGATFSSIQDAPTQVTEAKLVGARAEAPAYCQVRGYVTPQVGFELRLPVSNWNEKFIEIGCGGHCGDTNWTFWCRPEKGYACIA